MLYDSITVETPPLEPEVAEDSSFSEYTDEDIFIHDEGQVDDIDM